jgi:thymidine kinase
LPWGASENCFNFTGEHEQNFHNILKRNDKFYFSKVFSDQLYFYDIEKIKNVDFTIDENYHPFPAYGEGCNFEKKLTNFFLKNDYYRVIYKTNDYYKHVSF